MEYPWYRVFASAACLVVALALYAVVNRTRLGMMIRAGASNRDMVRGLGVDIRRLYRIVFAGGVALAALAGMIAAPLSSVYPGMGSSVLIICFVVVVIGGIGSITGALIASLLVGFVDTFGKVFFAEWSGVGVYVLMAIVLVWRPGRADEAWLLKAPATTRPARHGRRRAPRSARCPTSAGARPAAGSCRRRRRSRSRRCRSSSRPTARTSSSASRSTRSSRSASSCWSARPAW